MIKTNALIPLEEKIVDFYGDDLAAVLVKISGKSEPQIYVPVRPICDYLGLNWTGQYERIQRNLILSESLMFVRVTRTNRGGNPNLLCMPLKYIPGWLLGVQVERVREGLRNKILQYQRECYDVLWEAFQEGRLTANPDFSALLQSNSAAAQAYQMATAVMKIARQQLLLESQIELHSGQLSNHEVRLEQIEGSLGQSSNKISQEQASQVSQAVKAVAMQLTQRSGRNEYGGVYGEFYRKFGITSYKLLPANKFQQAIDFLTDWHQSLVTDAAF